MLWCNTSYAWHLVVLGRKFILRCNMWFVFILLVVVDSYDPRRSSLEFLASLLLSLFLPSDKNWASDHNLPCLKGWPMGSVVLALLEVLQCVRHMAGKIAPGDKRSLLRSA